MGTSNSTMLGRTVRIDDLGFERTERRFDVPPLYHGLSVLYGERFYQPVSQRLPRTVRREVLLDTFTGTERLPAAS